MNKAFVFSEINAGKVYGTIDKNKLQEAYADSNDFWELISDLLVADSSDNSIAFKRTKLKKHCLDITSALLDQAIDEQAKENLAEHLLAKGEDKIF